MSRSDDVHPLDPVEKNLLVPKSKVEAFDFFTKNFGDWWPIADGHSVLTDASKAASFECRTGGEIFEYDARDARAVWGRIVEWKPPSAFAAQWFPGRDEESAQRLEVAFSEKEGETEISLLHSEWEKLGALATVTRGNYDRGWDHVLDVFLRFCLGKSS